MEKETTIFDVVDDLNMCMINVNGFFNILKATDWDEPTIVEIAGTGKTLEEDMCKRVDEVCGVIYDLLGKIEIRRSWSRLPGSGPGEIVGLKFTASKILNEILRERTSGTDLCLEISCPEPTIRHGIFSFISDLEQAQKQVQSGQFGLHGTQHKIREVVGAINKFMDSDMPKVLSLKNDFEKTGEEISRALAKAYTETKAQDIAEQKQPDSETTVTQ